MKIKILLPLLALAFAGCATNPNAPEIAAQAEAAGYGAPPPANWQETIKGFMEMRLKDSTSAQYKFGEPRKGWLTKAPISGGGFDVSGYRVSVAINAKNSYGGYTGYANHEFLLRDGRVIAYADFTSGMGFWQKF